MINCSIVVVNPHFWVLVGVRGLPNHIETMKVMEYSQLN